MKKTIIYLSAVVLALGVLCFARTSFGQNRAEVLVEKMSKTMGAMGGYEAAFVVASGDEQLLGSFAVEGERYRIELADMVVFGEATERYEVNKARKEITLMQTESSSANILSNPAHAFELVGSLYRPVLLSEEGGKAQLSLQSEDDLKTTIRLVVNTATNLPSEIVYAMEGLELKIEIHTIKSLQTSLPKYDPAHYADYELIDFR